MTLAHEVKGSGPRVVLVHGFSQNRSCWGPFAERLALDHEVVLVDAPGHGGSRHDDADLVEAGRLLVQVGGRATYVGYSMGGRMVLHAAIGAPESVGSMVLIGATAGIDDESERAARASADESRALELIAGGLPAFLDAWLAMPMFARLSPAEQFRSEREANRVEGLAASLRRCGTGVQQPLWDRLSGLDVPTRVLVGQHDPGFVATAERIVSCLPEASIAVIPGAGHAAHLEKPDAVARIVAEATIGAVPHHGLP